MKYIFTLRVEAIFEIFDTQTFEGLVYFTDRPCLSWRSENITKRDIACPRIAHLGNHLILKCTIGERDKPVAVRSYVFVIWRTINKLFLEFSDGAQEESEGFKCSTLEGLWNSW